MCASVLICVPSIQAHVYIYLQIHIHIYHDGLPVPDQAMMVLVAATRKSWTRTTVFAVVGPIGAGGLEALLRGV